MPDDDASSDTNVSKEYFDNGNVYNETSTENFTKEESNQRKPKKT